jgi:hypothetical protein
MVTYDFTLVLSEPTVLTEDLAGKLFAAGCNDGTPSSCDGTVAIDFSRDASDLESAIRTAIANASAAGCVVERVEIDVDAASLK